MPDRVRLSRAKGWRMPDNTVKADRTTLLGNPFVTGKHGTQERCVELHRLLIAGYVAIGMDNVDAQIAHRKHVIENRAEYRGKNLGCWCRDGTPCHVDTLLPVFNCEPA